MIHTHLIESENQMEVAFRIRREVFVEEQKVPEDEEYDQFEDSSRHILAMVENVPAGTARWRFTENGIKLERFAVLASQRRKGVGIALVEKVLEDIQNHPEGKGKLLYMHAQLSAVSLYQKFNFKKEGDIFEECDIQHYKMTRPAFE